MPPALTLELRPLGARTAAAASRPKQSASATGARPRGRGCPYRLRRSRARTRTGPLNHLADPMPRRRAHEHRTSVLPTSTDAESAADQGATAQGRQADQEQRERGELEPPAAGAARPAARRPTPEQNSTEQHRCQRQVSGAARGRDQERREASQLSAIRSRPPPHGIDAPAFRATSTPPRPGRRARRAERDVDRAQIDFTGATAASGT